MTTARRPATPKARSTLAKLEALAERGIEGEKLAALRKIERLKSIFDFNGAPAAETGDLFQGAFKRSRKAAWIRSFQQTELDVSNAVKWAIESSTGIRCIYRRHDLMAEAAPATARRLATIAETIASSFRQLIDKFSTVTHANSADRNAFVMGLYDGMMNTPRDMGQRLPGRCSVKPRGRTKKAQQNEATGLGVHPYTLALGLGRQIRFLVPLAEITTELQNRVQPQLPGPVSDPTGQRAAAADGAD